jgi:hypothetical protein
MLNKAERAATYTFIFTSISFETGIAVKLRRKTQIAIEYIVPAMPRADAVGCNSPSGRQSAAFQRVCGFFPHVLDSEYGWPRVRPKTKTEFVWNPHGNASGGLTKGEFA